MAKVIKVLVNNAKSRIIAPLDIILQIKTETRIRAKGAFFSPAFRRREWDGYVNYISDINGIFQTGLLSLMLAKLELVLKTEEKKYKVVVEDGRDLFRAKYNPTELGGMEFFQHQGQTLDNIFSNTVAGLKFPRGIVDHATNAGKSMVAAGIFASLAPKRNGIFLTNSKTLFEQATKDLEKLLPGEVGWLSSRSTNWKRFNVCMIQTLGGRLSKTPEYKKFLANCDAVILDEADEAIGRKDCKSILSFCYNAPIRIALTGTALMSKDKNRNRLLIAYFGDILHSIHNKELVDKGISSIPDIRIFMGNTNDIPEGRMTWSEAYESCVIKNKQRTQKIWRIVSRFVRRDKIPILIMFKNHAHGNRIIRLCPGHIARRLKVELVHHKTKARERIFEDYNNGKIDILVASMIIKRGKNLPLTQVLINAAGGDSQANVLQVFGRLLRKHKSKKKVYMIDFWDKGFYLRRHSKHRVIYYRNQDFEVKELYKQKLKKR